MLHLKIRYFMLLFITVNCTNYSHKAFFYLYSSDVRIIDDRIKKKSKYIFYNQLPNDTDGHDTRRNKDKTTENNKYTWLWYFTASNRNGLSCSILDMTFIHWFRPIVDDKNRTFYNMDIFFWGGVGWGRELPLQWRHRSLNVLYFSKHDTC